MLSVVTVILACVAFSAHFAPNAAEGSFNTALEIQNGTGIVQQGPFGDSCSCGEHQISCMEMFGKKHCTCETGYADFNGYCKECNCGTGPLQTMSCKFDTSGNKICKCFSNYAPFGGMCKECNCGLKSTGCSFNSIGLKTCECPPTYKEKDGRCVAVADSCSCGEHQISCMEMFGKKHCTCETGYEDFNGYCKECNCGTGSLQTMSCKLDTSGNKICKCFSNYAPFGGMCKECNCGLMSTGCSFNSIGLKICECPPTYKEKDGRCEFNTNPFNPMIIVYSVIPILIIIGVIVFIVVRRRRIGAPGIVFAVRP